MGMRGIAVGPRVAGWLIGLLAAAQVPASSQTVPVCTGPTSRDASWSPDGGTIVFTSDRTGSYELWTLTVATGELRRLTRAEGSEFYPRYSPDGARIAFTTIGRSGQAVGLVDAMGGEVRHATTESEDAADPSWLPDGRIVYSAVRNGERDLWIRHPDSSGARLLFALDGVEWAPRLSPAGDRILFHSDRDGDFDVYTARLDGDELVRLSSGAGFDGVASWSPDGAAVAYYSRSRPESSTREAMQRAWASAEIRVVPSEGGASLRLTDDDVRDQSPAWSPDGATLAFTSCASGNLEIWSMATDGSNRRRLTRTVAEGAR